MNELIMITTTQDFLRKKHCWYEISSSFTDRHNQKET